MDLNPSYLTLLVSFFKFKTKLGWSLREQIIVSKAGAVSMTNTDNRKKQASIRLSGS